MDDIISTTTFVFDNSIHSKPFGNVESWENYLGLDKILKEIPNKKGVYWILSDFYKGDTSSIINGKLNKNGCDFIKTIDENRKTFTPDLLHSCTKNELSVIYNGHADDVRNRIQNHFNLNNNKTGALGIKKYALSNASWELRYFTLNDAKSSKIKNLLDSKSGRIYIENTWRTIFGWPILCKS